MNVIKTDYSLESITKAFQGQDAVVSLVGASALKDQTKLVDAAVKAGVKRFIPSEFGSDTSDDTVRAKVPIFNVKKEVVDHLRSKQSNGLSWTVLVGHSAILEIRLEIYPTLFRLPQLISNRSQVRSSHGALTWAS